MTTAVQFPEWPPDWAEVFGGDRFGMFAEFSVEGVGFVMRWVPPGTFLMGSSADEEGRYEREGPQHPVTISRGFWFGETPVTQAQYEAVTGENPSGFKGTERPVERVNCEEATAFCEALEKRQPGLGAGLPSEAEWETACRAGTGSAFNNGKGCTAPMRMDPALDEVGWFKDNSGGETKPVKQKRPNEWGLYDMHGNVWEWCVDRSGREYTETAQTDPVGSQDCVDRVVRGGSWLNSARYCSSASRYWYLLGDRPRNLGFRLLAGRAKPPPEATRR